MNNGIDLEFDSIDTLDELSCTSEGNIKNWVFKDFIHYGGIRTQFIQSTMANAIQRLSRLHTIHLLFHRIQLLLRMLFSFIRNIRVAESRLETARNIARVLVLGAIACGTGVPSIELVFKNFPRLLLGLFRCLWVVKVGLVTTDDVAWISHDGFESVSGVNYC